MFVGHDVDVKEFLIKLIHNIRLQDFESPEKIGLSQKTLDEIKEGLNKMRGYEHSDVPEMLGVPLYIDDDLDYGEFMVHRQVKIPPLPKEDVIVEASF